MSKISILKIGDSNNYLYNSDINKIERSDYTNWSWLVKFAYSFNDYEKSIQNTSINENVHKNEDEKKELVTEENEKQGRMIQLKKELRKELQEKKQSEQIQSEKKKSEQIQSKNKKRVKVMSQPDYKILTDEEYIIEKIFQNLQNDFPNIGNMGLESKKKYKNELLDAFSGLDENGDGTISKKEFIKVYNKKNPEQQLDLNNSNDKKKIDELFQSVGDKNKDGKIDKVEFIIYMISEDEAAAKKKKRKK